MTHPITRVREVLNRQRNNSEYYSKIAKEAEAKYRELTMIDPIERLGEVIASRVRIQDKFNLVKSLVGEAVGAIGDPDTLSDEEVLTIIASWATLEKRKWQ